VHRCTLARPFRTTPQVDRAGNYDRSPAVVTAVRDTVPPATTVDVVGPHHPVPALLVTAVPQATLDLALACSEACAGYYLSINGSSVNATGARASAPVLVTAHTVALVGLALGVPHAVRVQGMDLAGDAPAACRCAGVEFGDVRAMRRCHAHPRMQLHTRPQC
jgi:hypothetical protein